MKYDIVMYFANGTSLKYNECPEYNIANGVLYYTDAQGLKYVSNMPFVITVRKPRG